MSCAFELTADHHAAYERDGLLHIPAGVAPQAAASMAAVLWSALMRKHGIRPDDPATWTVPRPSGLSPLIPRNAFAAMASPTVCHVLDKLLGTDWTRPTRWGVTLVSFPERSSTWDVPCEQWHLDSPAVPEGPNIARVFVVLAAMEPRGGNTLVVRFMARSTPVAGVEVRVVELTGEPGDVYFMHPTLLHAPSPNVRSHPRLALTQWIEGRRV